MKAYYNDNDKHAVAWLKELIKAELIMTGDVDDRSIADVTKEDLKGYTQCHFFAGIGGWPYALELAGWPSDREVWSGSLPCQPFSVAGKGGGYSDERHLWPEFRRLIMECKPNIVFGEQVASSDGRNWLSGNKILQSVLDREAIVRVLQICNSLGELPPEMQRMLQGRGAREKKQDTERGEVKTFQGLQGKEKGINLSDVSKESGKDEGVGVLFGPAYRPPTRCDRCGRLRVDGHSFQSYRGEDMGQPFTGQGGLFDGVYAGQCSCGSLLRECDGESMGGEQDNRDIECDNGDSTLSVGGITEQIRIIFETTDEHRSLSGVRADLEAVGYAVGAADLCAASVQSPHIRQRLYWVADSVSRQEHTTNERGLYTESCSSSRDGRVDDSASRRCQGNQIGNRDTKPDDVITSSRNGFWSDFDLIPCGDGKARRIESGLQPLVAGLPKGMVYGGNQGEQDANQTAEARVMRLRGYGNSLTLPLAVEYIKVVMEVLDVESIQK